MTVGTDGGAPASSSPETGNEQPNGPVDQDDHTPAAAPESASATVARGIAAAAANPGGTSARNAQRAHARRNLDSGMAFDGRTTVTGDAVAGGKHIYYQATSTRREMRATELPDSHVDEYLETYLPPSTPHPHRTQDPIVIVRGTAGSGRYATALTLLNEPARRPTMLLDPRTVLEALADDRFAADAGYIVDTQDGDAVTEFELQRLDSELRSHRCSLVLIVSERYRPIEPAITGRILDLDEQPEPLDVVRAHVAFHGRRLRIADTGRLLDEVDKDILGLLPETAHRVGDHALLGRSFAETRGDVALLQRRLDTRDSHDFEKWFEDLPELYAQCFAISLAVLNSLSHQAIAEAARQLTALLDPKAERQRRSEAATPFRIGRTRLLDQVRASVTIDTIETRHGKTPAEVVSFVDPRYPGKLLRHVWQEHDEVRGPLVKWLTWLGRQGSPSVRIAGAMAAGTLAVSTFEHLRSHVLEAWATDRAESCRESAAIALETPAANPDLRAIVTALVGEWAAGGDIKLGATAARACGTAIGGQDPDVAMALLDDLITRDNSAILSAICASLAEWVGGEDAVLRHRAITAIHGWSTDRDPVRRTGGQLVFLFVGADLINEDSPWPTLLRLAAADGAVAERVVATWSAALVNPDLSEPARQILASWATTVEADDAAISAFVDMCGRTGNRSRAVIRHQARGWLERHSDRHNPRTATAVLNAIH